MTQEELQNLFVYKDGRLLCKKTGKQYAISTQNNKEYFLYKQKEYCLDSLIYLYFTGEKHKYVHHIDGNLSNNRIENLYVKCSPVTEYNKSSYPQIDSIEKLKQIFIENIFKEDGCPNQHAFSLNWWTKKNLPYVYFSIQEFKQKYGIENNIQVVYHVMNDIKTIPLCEVCNINSKIWYTYTSGYKTTCSIKCAHNHPKKHVKRQQTCVELYGVEHISQLQEIKDKKKETCLKNYGVENPSYSEDLQKKKIKTNLKKYGEEHYSKTQEFRDSVCLEFPLLKDKGWLEEQHKTKSTVEIAKELGTTATKVLFWIKNHGIEHKIYNIRSQQKEVQEYLDSIDITYKVNDRNSINPKELDVHVIDKKFAIEINGVYWHQEQKVGETYHIDKLVLCENNNIKLIQLWDFEWESKKEICKSIIKGFLNKNDRIYGRETVVKKIPSKICREFLENNHLQGYCKAKIKLGLFFKGELVSVMTFGKPRFNKKYQWELIRFCNKINVNVVGGASKLFSEFLKEYAPNNIISYSDKRLFSGGIYKTLGFNFLYDSELNYFYFKNGKILSRYECQKHKLHRVLSNKFDKQLTERENMINNGWYAIYDCGNSVWEYVRK